MKIEVAENIQMKTDLIEVKEKRLINKQKIYIASKRMIDIVVSSVALIVLMPFMLIVALLVKIDSKGNAIIIQERIGKNGKIFKMYKYRSMVIDAEEILKEYLKNNKEIRKEYEEYKKIKNDPRVTKMGSFIRKTSIDELPQLLNVLKGDMSLVGPRPYLPREKEDMKEYYTYIIESKPGLTGLWQISGRNDVSFNERLNIDYTYNKSKSLKFDFSIFMKTIFKVLKREGAI